MSRKDILGNEINTDCIGCAIAKGEMELPGGILYDGKSIILAADPEIPIPGFLIITSKRHIQSFAQLSEDERSEIGDTIAWAQKALKELHLAESVTLVQEERSKHFHIWIFPNQEWMKEKFGFGLQYMRDINAYARENATTEDTEKVIKAVEDIRAYKENHDITKRPENLYQMETIFQRASKNLNTLEASISELQQMQDDIQKLSDYYGSKQWRADFEADEKGLFPKDMTRGVLSEDGIYNLLDRYKEIMEMLEK